MTGALEAAPRVRSGPLRHAPRIRIPAHQRGHPRFGHRRQPAQSPALNRRLRKTARAFGLGPSITRGKRLAHRLRSFQRETSESWRASAGLGCAPAVTVSPSARQVCKTRRHVVSRQGNHRDRCDERDRSSHRSEAVRAGSVRRSCSSGATKRALADVLRVVPRAGGRPVLMRGGRDRRQTRGSGSSPPRSVRSAAPRRPGQAPQVRSRTGTLDATTDEVWDRDDGDQPHARRSA